MKTQAAVLVKTKHPLEIMDIEVPKLKYGQVLVEIKYSGACGTQISEIQGNKGEDKWLPHCMGHEGTGVVVECGAGVSRVAPGDFVVLTWIKGEGLDAGGAQYSSGGRTINAGAVTTFQKHSIVSENRLYLLRDSKNLDLAVLLGCAAPTGIGAVKNVLNLTKGSSIAIFGAGGIGLKACLAARMAGAENIVIFDPKAKRREMAMTFGALRTVDNSNVEIVESIIDEFKDKFDYAIEASGKPEAMKAALDVVKPQGGKAVIVGNAPHGEILELSPSSFNKGKSLLGTWGGDSLPQRDYSFYFDTILSEKEKMGKLLAKSYSLENINDALIDLQKGSIGRPLINMSL